MAKHGWIGVDLDSTLAVYDGWRGVDHIGDPVPAMLARVKDWLKRGIEVRIFTARVSGDSLDESMRARRVINAWCVTNGLPMLPITCIKDFHMVTLWDDRAVHVIPNTGEPLGACAGSGFSSY